jgi:transposase-like protein
MFKPKSEDYKISAVNYYLDNDVSMDYVCNIFNCKKQSLSRWVKKSIRKVKKNNYENYFEYAYNKSKSYKQKTKK